MTTESREQQIAQRRNQALRRSFRSTCFWYLISSIVFGLAAALIAITGLWLVAFCSFVAALICLLQCFDTLGNLRDIESRPADRLFWSKRPDTGPQGAASQESTTDPTTGHTTS